MSHATETISTKMVDAWLDETDTANEGASAYEILAALRRQLRIQRYTTTEIEDIIKEAQSSNYDHMVDVVLEYMAL